MDDFDNWQPRPDEINSLPDKVRHYIMELETRCDPAGDVAALTLLRDQVRQLEASNATLRAAAEEATKREHERLREAIEPWLITIDAHATVIADPEPKDDIAELCSCIHKHTDTIRAAIRAGEK